MPAVIGKPAPAFSANSVLPDGSFKTVSLSDYKGACGVRCTGHCLPARPLTRCGVGKYAVLFFYPLDFTFVCPVRPKRRAASRKCPGSTFASPFSLGARLLTHQRWCADGDHRLLGPRQGVRGHQLRGAWHHQHAFLTDTEALSALPSHAPVSRALRRQLVGCSIDSVFSHLAWVNTPRNKGGLGGIAFTLLADVTKAISKDYGVLIEHGDDAGIALRCVRVRTLSLHSPSASHSLLCAAVCSSSTRRACCAKSPSTTCPLAAALTRCFVWSRHSRHVRRCLRGVRALTRASQFVDKHGEVCPANWTPGAASMKADPKGSLEYFSKQ